MKMLLRIGAAVAAVVGVALLRSRVELRPRRPRRQCRWPRRTWPRLPWRPPPTVGATGSLALTAGSFPSATPVSTAHSRLARQCE